MKRIITGLLLVGAVVGAFFLRQVNTVFFGVFLAIIAAACILEMAFALRKATCKKLLVLSFINALLLYPVFLFGGEKIVTAFYALLAVAALTIMIADTKVDLNAVAGFMFTLIYPSLFFVLMLLLNQSDYALFLLIAVFLTGPASDTFAFVVGCTVKGKKLCPAVSPNKTVAGAIGALFGGAAAGLVIYGFFQLLPELPVPAAGQNIVVMLLMGVLGGAFTVLGDLAESAIKRRLEIKDFSRLLPGHGGMLDRMDSIMFNAAFVYIYFSCFFVI